MEEQQLEVDDQGNIKKVENGKNEGVSSRKLLVLDFAHGNPMTNISIAALIVGLALAYFLLKKGETN